jgi:hypothetical protein
MTDVAAWYGRWRTSSAQRRNAGIVGQLGGIQKEGPADVACGVETKNASPRRLDRRQTVLKDGLDVAAHMAQGHHARRTCPCRRGGLRTLAGELGGWK